MYEEDSIRACMGATWNANSALAVAFNTQVIQSVCQMFPGNSDSIDGNPMINDLDEQCVKGNAELLNGNWRVRCTPKVEKNRQYLRGWTFRLDATRRNLVWIP